MLAAAPPELDPTIPGLLAGDLPADSVSLLAAIAADVRPATLAPELGIMADTDLSDLPPHVAVPTLLLWGEKDARSPLNVARQLEQSIPGARLVVIARAGHLSIVERPDRVNDALREFCRAHPPRPGNELHVPVV